MRTVFRIIFTYVVQFLCTLPCDFIISYCASSLFTSLASLKNCGDVTLVRVGRKSQVHSSVSEFWLETMAKNKLQEKRSVSTVDVNINEHKDDLNACTAELEELEKRIWALQSTTLSANQEIEEKVNLVSDSEVAIREERI